MIDICIFDIIELCECSWDVGVLFDDDSEHGGYAYEIEEEEASHFGIGSHHVWVYKFIIMSDFEV
jgi:hypothetical protein